MKKLGISLLVLALVLSFTSANAAIGARAAITAGGTNTAVNPSNFIVLGLNNIDILFHYSSADKDLTATEGTTALAIGGTYYFAKLGEVKVGAHGLYASTSGPAKATVVESASSIKLGLDLQAPIANGLAVGVTGYVYETNGGKTTADVEKKGSDMGLWSSYAVYVQATAF